MYMKKFIGKISTFGGPEDMGVTPAEGLAFFDERDLAAPEHKSLFLPESPPGTTGLARRLNPAKMYIAMRWDYSVTPKSWLRLARVVVTNPRNGKRIYARPADWGPHTRTGRVADLSPGLAQFLEVSTDEEVEIEVPISEDDPNPKIDPTPDPRDTNPPGTNPRRGPQGGQGGTVGKIMIAVLLGFAGTALSGLTGGASSLLGGLFSSLRLRILEFLTPFGEAIKETERSNPDTPGPAKLDIAVEKLTGKGSWEWLTRFILQSLVATVNRLIGHNWRLKLEEAAENAEPFLDAVTRG